MTDQEAAALGREALAEVKPGAVVGLGTGQAATAFIHALGQAVKSGLRVTGVPTSEASAKLARTLGIPLIAEPTALDVAVDGADEVDPAARPGQGLRWRAGAGEDRGGGGASLHRPGRRRKSSSRRSAGVAGSRSRSCRSPRRSASAASPRWAIRPWSAPDGASPVVTDNGNLILDCAVKAITDPAALDRTLCEIPGVVGTGLFVAMAHAVMVWDGGRVRTLTRDR